MVFPADVLAQGERSGGQVGRVCSPVGFKKGVRVKAIGAKKGITPARIDGIRFVEFEMQVGHPGPPGSANRADFLPRRSIAGV